MKREQERNIVVNWKIDNTQKIYNIHQKRDKEKVYGKNEIKWKNSSKARRHLKNTIEIIKYVCGCGVVGNNVLVQQIMQLLYID